MNFISRKTLLKHWLWLSIIILLLGFGLFIFLHFQERISNYKSYYFDSVQYDIKSAFTSPESDASRSLKTIATSVPILLYHGITEKSNGYDISYRDFKEQLFKLHENGYKTVSLEEYYLFLDGKKDLPEKSFLLTFDDGRKDSYYPVDPLLNYLGFRATMFVITDQSLSNDSNYYLSKSELKRMIASGRWDIGAHANIGHRQIIIDGNDKYGNFLSNKAWLKSENRLENDDEYRKRIHDEIASAKESLEKELNIAPLAFAFPFGDFGQNESNYPNGAKQVINDEISNNYKGAFAQTKITPFSQSSPYYNDIIQYRIELTSEDSANGLLERIRTGLSKTLPYSDEFDASSGWEANWGDIEIINYDSLKLKATSQSTGARAILDGGQNWKNYTFSIKESALNGRSITLYSHYFDDNNFISCTFTNGYTRMDVTIDGKKNVIQEVKNQEELELSKGANISMSVDENNASCLLDDKLIVEGIDLTNLPKLGTIGISIWDEEPGTSTGVISDVKVKI